MSSNYIPYRDLRMENTQGWVTVDLGITPIDLHKRQAVLWCINNVETGWSMLGSSTFLFEDQQVATIFYMTNSGANHV